MLTLREYIIGKGKGRQIVACLLKRGSGFKQLLYYLVKAKYNFKARSAHLTFKR
jgi:hypothetical protein